MSRIKMLLNVVSDLRSLADSLEQVADVMGNPRAEKDEPKSSPPPKKAEQQITLEQVRALLAEKSNNGYTAEVRELLKKHGADKLSGIDPSEYAALLADAEVLGDG